MEKIKFQSEDGTSVEFFVEEQTSIGGTAYLLVSDSAEDEAQAYICLLYTSDTRIRLKGKGVPSLRNKNVRGDHYVTLVVQVPTNLNAEAKEALRKFDEACGNRPSASKGEAGEKQEKPEKKKKSFMDKLKETFEE